MKKLFWTTGIALLVLAACNYDEGQCWIDGEGAGSDGAGAGPIVPGTGGYGDVPPDPQDATDPRLADCNAGDDPDKAENPKKQEDDSCNPIGADVPTADGTTYAHCTGTCAGECPAGGVNGFSSSVFKFTTIVPDDGKDEAGGWQAATASLKFYRWTGLFPDLPWTCSVTVGMPLRAAAYGTISHTYAATISAGIASQAGMDLMHVKPKLPPGVFCSKLGPTMQALFKAQYLNLGATVK
jgi:hypothetical protein